MTVYRRPAGLDEALACLAEGPHTIIAGATDLYPTDANRRGWGHRPMVADPDGAFLDISRISALKSISSEGRDVRIGAMVTWTEAIASPLGAWFDGVRLAARDVGGPQVQNRGTLVGNLCNASPAADGVPALLALDARVVLENWNGRREVPLTAFITGNRATVLESGELVTGVIVPQPDREARDSIPPAPAQSGKSRPGAHLRSTFLKLGARRHLVISIAMVAVSARVQDDRIADVRIAVGACSPVAQRLQALEARLDGQAVDDAPAMASDDDLAVLTPIDDVRATGPYRSHAALELVRRGLAQVCRPAESAA